MTTTLSGRLGELFDAASIVSEGETRDEEGEIVYYGMTSMLFSIQSTGGLLPDAAQPDLAFALRYDPHARLRVVRTAHREAWTRAGAKLGPMRAEVTVASTTHGIMVSVDVMACVFREHASGALS